MKRREQGLPFEGWWDPDVYGPPGDLNHPIRVKVAGTWTGNTVAWFADSPYDTASYIEKILEEYPLSEVKFGMDAARLHLVTYPPNLGPPPPPPPKKSHKKKKPEQLLRQPQQPPQPLQHGQHMQMHMPPGWSVAMSMEGGDAGAADQAMAAAAAAAAAAYSSYGLPSPSSFSSQAGSGVAVAASSSSSSSSSSAAPPGTFPPGYPPTGPTPPGAFMMFQAYPQQYHQQLAPQQLQQLQQQQQQQMQQMQQMQQQQQQHFYAMPAQMAAFGAAQYPFQPSLPMQYAFAPTGYAGGPQQPQPQPGANGAAPPPQQQLQQQQIVYSQAGAGPFLSPHGFMAASVAGSGSVGSSLGLPSSPPPASTSSPSSLAAAALNVHAAQEQAVQHAASPAPAPEPAPEPAPAPSPTDEASMA
jgi:hypothetical protein